MSGSLLELGTRSRRWSGVWLLIARTAGLWLSRSIMPAISGSEPGASPRVLEAVGLVLLPGPPQKWQVVAVEVDAAVDVRRRREFRECRDHAGCDPAVLALLLVLQAS